MSSKLVISVSVELPADVLEAAKAQVAILEPFKTFIDSISDDSVEQSIQIVSDGSTPAPALIQARKPRGPNKKKNGAAAGEPDTAIASTKDAGQSKAAAPAEGSPQAPAWARS